MQKHSLYIEPHVIEELKQKYNSEKRLITRLNKIEKENSLSTEFICRELEKMEEYKKNAVMVMKQIFMRMIRRGMKEIQICNGI